MGDTLTDADVRAEIDRYTEIVRERRALLAEALRRLAEAAGRDRLAVLTGAAEVTLSLSDAYEATRSAERLVHAGRHDLAAWEREWARREPLRDTASSASRQHYIDTGVYLDRAES